MGAFSYLENLALDTLHRLRGEQPWNEEIMVIGIDDSTLDSLGLMPLSRRYYAELLEILNEAGAGVVALDFLMTDESPEDEALSEAMLTYKHNAVVLAGATSVGGRFLNPSQILLDSAVASGHINQEPDIDGITRKHILYTSHTDSLASATAKAYSLTTNLINLPLGQLMHINWPGNIENVYYASLIDVLNKKIPADKLKGKVIFVGSTATAQGQQLRTPFNTRAPVWGVYIHAAVMHNLLEQNW
ncbi:MAG: CHASE2 domain-containing protein, partial [Cyanobacteria bacterium P01_F01_bin.116]